MQYNGLRNNSWIVRFIVFITLILSLLSLTALMDGSKPFTKENIINLVSVDPTNKLRAFSDEEITERIKERKTSFEITPSVETELTTAGASPQIITVCKENYQPLRSNTPTPAPTIISGDEPLSKAEILDLLKKKVPSARIEKEVETRGASFNLDTNSTAEIKSLGGTNSLIGAIASKYIAVNNSPLTKNEILDMLQKKVVPSKIESTVEKRGVSFNLDATTTSQIKQAGGSNSLIGAIASKYVASSTPSNTTNTTITTSLSLSAGYYDCIDRALAAFRAKNLPLVTSETLKAIAIDDKLPQAHTLLGFANLYLAGNVNDARKYFTNALDRGGEVSFVVINDRKSVSDKVFIAMEGGGAIDQLTKKIPGFGRKPATPTTTAAAFTDSCKGSLFISKNRVKFQADDNKNSFDVPTSLILGTEVNKSYGKERNAFHIKVKAAGDEKKNYNFAMGSAFISGSVQPFTINETNLAVSLITLEKSRN